MLTLLETRLETLTKMSNSLSTVSKFTVKPIFAVVIIKLCISLDHVEMTVSLILPPQTG